MSMRMTDLPKTYYCSRAWSLSIGVAAAGGEGDFVDDATISRARGPRCRLDTGTATVEANAFAAALLMDGNLVVRRWREVPDVRAITPLPGAEEAMALRL